MTQPTKPTKPTKPTPSVAPEEEQAAASPVRKGTILKGVLLERTGCFGSCPYYSVEIKRDGRVKYHGEMYVRVTGAREARIGAAAAAALLDSLDRQALWETSWGRGCGRTDAPSIKLTLWTDKDEEHRIEYSLAGECLQEKLPKMANQIDLAARTATWVKCPGGKCPHSPVVKSP